MFGTFRMFLALNVVVGHMGGSYFGIIMPGIAAVVCFFMISGYAMSGLIQGSYPRLPEDVGHFYLDRILRLGPQYYFLSCCCCLHCIRCRLAFFRVLPIWPRKFC